MKAAVQVLFFLFVFSQAGCDPGAGWPLRSNENDSRLLAAYASYSAAKVDIMPLSGCVSAGPAQDVPQIKVYVGVVGSFGCQIKWPGVFRFELYEYVPRTAAGRGRRIMIWPDVDLTEAAENNSYWRDYLRAYEFNLDFEPQPHRNYVLEVTFRCPRGRRLSDDFVFKSAE
ncbi:MAG: hypothetical protein ACYS76_09430 [Planctomycetota bacterium]|jgi:hypothetical protein